MSNYTNNRKYTPRGASKKYIPYQEPTPQKPKKTLLTFLKSLFKT